MLPHLGSTQQQILKQSFVRNRGTNEVKVVLAIGWSRDEDFKTIFTSFKKYEKWIVHSKPIVKEDFCLVLLVEIAITNCLLSFVVFFLVKKNNFSYFVSEYSIMFMW